MPGGATYSDQVDDVAVTEPNADSTPLRALVVDSIIALLRQEFPRHGELAERQQLSDGEPPELRPGGKIDSKSTKYCIGRLTRSPLSIGNILDDWSSEKPTKDWNNYIEILVPAPWRRNFSPLK